MSNHNPRRNTLRLPGYDYRNPGYYFVTIDTYQQQFLFGEVIDARMHLNPLGEIVKRHWLIIPRNARFIHLDRFVIMPNHMHGIVHIMNSAPEVPKEPFPTAEIKANSLSVIIRTFKAAVTRSANRELEAPPVKIWHRSFNDRIIREEESLDDVRFYINNNPKRWWKNRKDDQHRA